jgi:TonB family protein
MRSRSRLYVGAAFVASLPAVAHAQPEPGDAPPPAASPPPTPTAPDDASQQPPARSDTTLPVLKKDEGAAYPAQALAEGIHDAVEVRLVLTIDASGLVTNAVLDSPVGHGFDEAALDAARKLVFDPATRDGKPVAAKFRYLYRFPAPPSVLAGRVVSLAGERPLAGATVVVRDGAGNEQMVVADAGGAWRVEGLAAGTYHVTVTAPGRAPHEADQTVEAGEEASAIDRLDIAKPAAPPPDAGTEVEEVEVHGEAPPREVTKRTLEQREINRIPGTGGDALRSLQNLPGVGRPPALAGLLLVRGAAPQDSVYFVDGTPVPLVYHFGGLSSVVPTEMIDKLDFYPGNFSTQYGRAMGGVVDVGLLDPKADKFHGLAEVDLIDSRLLAQGPIGDTGWRFAVAGRRSYIDTWLGPVLKAANAGINITPVYYDYQAVLERNLDKHSTIRFAFFGSDDRIDILTSNVDAGDPTLAGAISSHMGFWRGQAVYKTRFSDTTELRVVGAVGQDYVNFNAGSINFDLTDLQLSSRAEIAQKLNPHLTMDIGVDLLFAPYTVSAVLPPLPKPGQPPSGPFSEQLPLATRTTGSIDEPAAYIEWEATPWKGARIVPGIRLDYTQQYANGPGTWDLDPRLTVRQEITSSPRTTIKGGLGIFSQPPQQQETNAVFGIHGLTDNRCYQYDLGLEREFTRNVEASLEGFYKQLDNLVEAGLGNTGTGVIYGGETMLRYKPDARFFGWISYTLSRSTRRIAPGMPSQLFEYDETHILTLLGSYRLGRGWEIGSRFRLISGYLYTPNTYGFYDENIGTYLPLEAYPQYGSRLPMFTSLDIRVDKTWKFAWGQIGAYLDVLNVYNAGNVDGISYDFNYTHTAYANDLPILPSLGFRVEM